MDESRLAFLRRLIASPSPSGFEQPVQQAIREEIRHYADEVHTDVHGNVIAALNPTAHPRVMLTAHCDESLQWHFESAEYSLELSLDFCRDRHTLRALLVLM